MSYTKRCFDSVGALSRRNPQVLTKVMSHFPEYSAASGVDLSAGELDLEAVRNALMSDQVPEALDDILYLSSALGTPNGWTMIERQAEEDGMSIPSRNPELTDVDMAVLAAIHNWPKNLNLLERANARARIHGKSAYKYYAPVADLRHKYRAPTPASLAEAEETMRQHFVEQGFIRTDQGKSLRIVPYDFENEIWFLIRYADKKRRYRGCESDGEWKSFVFNPEQYDAVVYNKVFGDLRMNTKNQRKKDHAKYRLAVGRMLLDEGGAFQDKKKMVTLRPLEEPFATALFETDDLPGLYSIEPVELDYTMPHALRSYTVVAKKEASLRVENDLAPRLVPDRASVTRAVFEYRIKDSRRRSRLTISAGNKVNFERDGDSIVLEEWLRRRGFVLSFVGDAANGVAVQQAA